MANNTRRRYTAELLKGYKRGINRVVCSLAPYEEQEVVYKPRHLTDSQPWVLVGYPDAKYRLSGRECHLLNWRFQTEVRNGVYADERRFVVIDSVSGVIVYRSPSRYAAEARATCYETTPGMALVSGTSRADGIQEGDTVFLDGAVWNSVTVTDVRRDGDDVWIAFGDKYATPYSPNALFVVGRARTEDVAL